MHRVFVYNDCEYSFKSVPRVNCGALFRLFGMFVFNFSYLKSRCYGENYRSGKQNNGCSFDTRGFIGGNVAIIFGAGVWVAVFVKRVRCFFGHLRAYCV